MPRNMKSTEVQQSFGAMLDFALGEDDVIVERYGTPRVAVVAYHRYRTLVEAEQELTRLRLEQASAAVAARTAHLSDAEIDQLIEEARNEAHEQMGR